MIMITLGGFFSLFYLPFPFSLFPFSYFLYLFFYSLFLSISLSPFILIPSKEDGGFFVR